MISKIERNCGVESYQLISTNLYVKALSNEGYAIRQTTNYLITLS